MGNMNWNASKAPLFGQFFEDPEATFQKEQFHKAANIQQQMRPEYAQGILNALNQNYSLFQPLNDAIGQMYGAGAMFDTQTATQNPLSPRTYDIGAPNEFKPTQTPWDKWKKREGPLRRMKKTMGDK